MVSGMFKNRCSSLPYAITSSLPIPFPCYFQERMDEMLQEWRGRRRSPLLAPFGEYRWRQGLEEEGTFLLSAFVSNLLAKFGANAILGVSLAVCKAGAAERELPLYRHIAQLAGNSDLILPVPVSLPATPVPLPGVGWGSMKPCEVDERKVSGDS